MGKIYEYGMNNKQTNAKETKQIALDAKHATMTTAGAVRNVDSVQINAST